MKLTITSASRAITYEIVWLEAETPTGNYVIQPGHVGTTLILLQGQPITFCLKSGKQEVITPIHNSIMHINPHHISILIDE